MAKFLKVCIMFLDRTDPIGYDYHVRMFHVKHSIVGPRCLVAAGRHARSVAKEASLRDQRPAGCRSAPRLGGDALRSASSATASTGPCVCVAPKPKGLNP